MPAVCRLSCCACSPRPAAAVRLAIPPDDPPSASCSTVQAESALQAAFAAAPSEVDFSFAAERGDGRVFRYQRGDSTLQTVYESASTSKLVSATIILCLLDQSLLHLDDHPQDRIPGWPLPASDPLSAMTLAQLLSFTSGLTSEPACLNLPTADFESCVLTIARSNAGNGRTPGAEFYYDSAHLQVAGLMAVHARGVASWQNLFAEFQSQTSQFPTARYDLPSAGNPRLAAGMHWTGDEYLGFLRALTSGALLAPATMVQMLADQTANAVIVKSPIMDRIGEDWHYGFGLWQECRSDQYDCPLGTRVSSLGAYGGYPFWDRRQKYFGILARQGPLGSFPDGLNTERAAEPQLNAWAACTAP